MKPIEPDQMSVVDLFGKVNEAVRYLLSKWILILGICVLFGLLGVLIAWLQKPTYVAEMKFVTEEDEGLGLGLYAGIAAQFGVDLGTSGGSAFEGENLIELLKSRTLIETTLLTPSANVSGSPLMIHLYIRNHNVDKNWSKEPLLRNVQFHPYPLPDADRVRDSIIGKIYTRLIKTSIDISKKDKKLNIISLTVKDENEFFAKRFVELLASNAIQYYADYKSRKSRINVEILQRQTDSVRRMLFGNISEVATMNDLNVNPIRQTMRTGSQRKQVDVQVNAALYGELVKNLELSKIALRKETPLIQIIDSPKFPLEKKKLGRLLTGIIFAAFGGMVAAGILLVRQRMDRPASPNNQLAAG